MPTRRSILFATLLTCLMLVISACGPRATGGATIEMAGDATAAVDLPAVVIDYDTLGTPSMGGLPLSSLAGLLGLSPDVVGQLQLDPNLITQLTKANIQHAQIDNSVDGILILVNGEPIPSVIWDEQSLVTAAEVIDMAGFGIELLDTVLPLIKSVGIGTIVRFPVAADAALIPAVVVGEGSAAAAVQEMQDAFLDTIGKAAQIQLIVTYADDGTWTVDDMDATQWSQVVPAPWEDLNLTPELVSKLSDGGINTIGFATNRDGLFVSVNGKTLPYIAWNQGELQHLLNLIGQPEMLGYLIGGDSSSIEGMLPVLGQWLPILQVANTRLTVNFP